eukprot:m51a1_g9374 hypothetical protein (380) ;mRNA; r:198491-199786
MSYRTGQGRRSRNYQTSTGEAYDPFDAASDDKWTHDGYDELRHERQARGPRPANYLSARQQQQPGPRHFVTTASGVAEDPSGPVPQLGAGMRITAQVGGGGVVVVEEKAQGAAGGDVEKQKRVVDECWDRVQELEAELAHARERLDQEQATLRSMQQGTRQQPAQQQQQARTPSREHRDRREDSQPLRQIRQPREQQGQQREQEQQQQHRGGSRSPQQQSKLAVQRKPQQRQEAASGAFDVPKEPSPEPPKAQEQAAAGTPPPEAPQEKPEAPAGAAAAAPESPAPQESKDASAPAEAAAPEQQQQQQQQEQKEEGKQEQKKDVDVIMRIEISEGVFEVLEFSKGDDAYESALAFVHKHNMDEGAADMIADALEAQLND